MSNKRVTSQDVARHVGTSRSVVSAVLNGTKGIRVSEETRQAVLQAIEDLNYHVDAQARGMKTGKSGCIAAFGDMKSPLFLQTLEGMQKACAAQGYHIVLPGNVAGEEGRYDLLTLYRQRQIDGILTLDPTDYRDEKWAEAVHEAQIPYVSVEGYPEDDRVASVQADYGQSVTDALDYLARHMERGAAAPVYLKVHHTGSREVWSERTRRESYECWCLQRGLAPVVHLIAEGSEEEMMRAFYECLGSERPIPPLLLNWSSAAWIVYRFAWDKELRIGRDIVLMTADNTLRSNRYMVPTLSCMEIPYAAMGQAGVECLLAQIENEAAAPLKQIRRATLFPGDSG